MEARPGRESPGNAVPTTNRSKGTSMTDLEAHVSAAGRAELVQQVREKIGQLGIQYIYYQFVSVTGRIVGKGIPADHWERTAERGFQLVYGSYIRRSNRPTTACICAMAASRR